MMNYGEMEARPTVVLTKDTIKKFLPKYKRHDDLIIIQESAWEELKRSVPVPVVSAENSPFSIDEDELASIVCQTIQKPVCRRLAIDRGVKDDDFRSPDIELILGDNGIVEHRENHILYRFDITKCMFSFGNINEKMRMADLDCSNEIVVDLFAGIGYFTLPLLVHAKAKHLYACEWNPDAVRALESNLKLNKVEACRYTVIEGDNKSNKPTDVAQRVLLGILPSCMDWLPVAFQCINKTTGATLHCHDLVESKPRLGDKRTSVSSLGASTDKPSSASQSSLLNQSLSSSSSTIEKLSAPFDERSPSSESDKDTSSPVMLERPSDILNETGNNLNDTSSLSSQHDESISGSTNMSDRDLSLYESRGQTLVARIEECAQAHNLKVTLTHIQPVKSYAPHITHVVFDIRVEPEQMSQHISSVTNLKVENHLTGT